jgi:gas vesicle protein
MEDDKRIPYFLLGLGIGTALGVLFAPKAGPETREFILARADDSKEFLKRKTVELKDNATEIVDRGKQAISKQKDNLSARIICRPPWKPASRLTGKRPQRRRRRP